eukprot:COSAG02_NODE_1126_length_14431_cov_37.854452_14_plen_87_part_00
MRQLVPHSYRSPPGRGGAGRERERALRRRVARAGARSSRARTQRHNMHNFRSSHSQMSQSVAQGSQNTMTPFKTKGLRPTIVAPSL